MNKRILGISLILLWIFPYVFTHLSCSVERSNHREAAFAAIHFESETDAITWIYESFESVDWEVSGKEFYRNGRLYDVLEIVDCGDGLCILCKMDSEEEHIVNKYEDLKHKSQHPQSEWANEFAKLHTCIPSIYTSSFEHKISERSYLVAYSVFEYGIPSLELFAPPPEV